VHLPHVGPELRVFFGTIAVAATVAGQWRRWLAGLIVGLAEMRGRGAVVALVLNARPVAQRRVGDVESVLQIARRVLLRYEERVEVPEARLDEAGEGEGWAKAEASSEVR
jgi:hypothetical protein